MSKAEFDVKEHARELLEVESILAYVQMLSEGMTAAHNDMDNDKAYKDMAAGAFGVLNFALGTAWGNLSESGHAFVCAHGLHYPLDEEVCKT